MGPTPLGGHQNSVGIDVHSSRRLIAKWHLFQGASSTVIGGHEFPPKYDVHNSPGPIKIHTQIKGPPLTCPSWRLSLCVLERGQDVVVSFDMTLYLKFSGNQAVSSFRPVHSGSGDLLSSKPQKTQGNGWFSKRTMVGKNGRSQPLELR